MGEAKKKLMIACRCGSGAPAGQCCLTSRGWHKRPELIKVRNTGHSGSHASCYLNATGACSSKISGEHLVSHGILKLLAKKKMVISGLPWLKGAKKLVGFTSMTTNCLCTTHNSALSPLDLVGVRLFEAVRKCQTHKSGTGQRYLFSGHDIERWQFKTFLAFSVSKNLGIRGVAPERRVEPNIAFADFLEDVERWKRPLGMYLFHKMGRTFKRKDTFGFGPVVALKSNEIVGMLTAIQGIHMGLLATDRFPEIAATSYKGVYRPGSLIFRLGKVTHRIQLSWEDGLQHPDITMILRNTR